MKGAARAHLLYRRGAVARLDRDDVLQPRDNRCVFELGGGRIHAPRPHPRHRTVHSRRDRIVHVRAVRTEKSVTVGIRPIAYRADTVRSVRTAG